MVCSNMYCPNGGVLRLAQICCGNFCPRSNGQFLVLGTPFKLFQIGAVNGGKQLLACGLTLSRYRFETEAWSPKAYTFEYTEFECTEF